jgi:hypothetical protein
MPSPLRTEHDRSIDDVGNTCNAAKLTCLPRSLVVQGFDLDFRRPEEPCRTCLTSPVAPRLTHRARPHSQRVSMLASSRQDRKSKGARNLIA